MILRKTFHCLGYKLQQKHIILFKYCDPQETFHCLGYKLQYKRNYHFILQALEFMYLLKGYWQEQKERKILYAREEVAHFPSQLLIMLVNI